MASAFCHLIRREQDKVEARVLREEGHSLAFRGLEHPRLELKLVLLLKKMHEVIDFRDRGGDVDLIPLRKWVRIDLGLLLRGV